MYLMISEKPMFLLYYFKHDEDDKIVKIIYRSDKSRIFRI